MIKEFPILKGIHYLDNAATTQKPDVVIESVKNYYLKYNANMHRGIYELSEISTELFEQSRNKLKEFFNAKRVIFSSGATQAFNDLSRFFKNKKALVLEIEHHSNYLPWFSNCKAEVLKLKDFENESFLDKISKFDVISFTMMSNVSGYMPNLEIIKKIKEKNPDIYVVLDACQYAPHKRIDFEKIGADFIVFSSHKMYGPLGVGIILANERIDELEPYTLGGGMLLELDKWKESPYKFEAGSQNGEAIYGFLKAIEYLEKDFDSKIKKEQELTKYLVESLRKENVKVIGHDKENFGPVVSFVLEFHPHDVSSFAAKNNVCIRAGHHCAKPYMKLLGVDATSRASVSFYNTKEDIHALIESIKNIRSVLNG